MAIGWESNKLPEINRIKIDVQENLDEFNFWEGIDTPGSPLISEAIDPKTQEINQFKVVSVTKTARYDKVEGASGEVVYIYGDWREGAPRIGNTISIIPCLCCVHTSQADLNCVSNEQNYLIIHSKKSLVTTNIIESLECVRKAMLMEKTVQFDRKVTKPLIHGIIIHEWLDLLIKNKNITIPAVAKELKNIICKYIFELYQIQQPLGEAFSEIFIYFGALKGFISKLEYTKSEESKTVHSELLQLKGKPDVIIVNNQKETEIELKTGQRLHLENIAQVVLYGLLQREQKGYTSQKLFHLKNSEIKDVFLKHFEVIHILGKRNRMVREAKLPRRKEISHCNFCSVGDICLTTSQIERAAQVSQKEMSQRSQDKGATPSDLDLLINLDLSNSYLFGYIWEKIQEEEDLSKENAILAIVEMWDNNYLKVRMKEESAATFYNGEFIMIYDKGQCAFGRGIVTIVNGGVIEIHMHERLIYNHGGTVLVSKDPCLKMFAELRTSLLHLFSSEKVKTMWMSTPVQVQTSIPQEFVPEFLQLNSDQQSALFNALHIMPYTLIHGMPGTGKTRVIALLTKIVTSQKKTVLICCHTHLSLTNIEKRLEGVPFIQVYRTGRTKVNHVLENKNLSETFDVFSGYNVILSTTRALYTDPIFADREFDMYIADEATQQNFLCSVLPSMLSKSIVLVGDHLQLSPLSKTDCLGVSLFDILRRKHPINALTMQYRMPKCIMDVSNELFYQKKMKCKVSEKGCISFWDMSNVPLLDMQDMIVSFNPDAQILCYFNEQVRKIRFLGREAETVDKFQGSESDHILLVVDLFLESTPRQEILVSPERLNVGITRAKKTLTIAGRVKFLETIPLFSSLLNIVHPVVHLNK
ncbi:DNA replication ATP-dependent helicase/nuclease Dna2 [Nematocida sp. AWRm79]|nr:DNA replication ATP-dependent helicase/nuclease Dna2 [Nematocida sp. AWRm79]